MAKQRVREACDPNWSLGCAGVTRKDSKPSKTRAAAIDDLQLTDEFRDHVGKKLTAILDEFVCYFYPPIA